MRQREDRTLQGLYAGWVPLGGSHRKGGEFVVIYFLFFKLRQHLDCRQSYMVLDRKVRKGFMNEQGIIDIRFDLRRASAIVVYLIQRWKRPVVYLHIIGIVLSGLLNLD